MAAQDHAKAGRFDIGELDLDTAITKLAGDLAREPGEGAGQGRARTEWPDTQAAFGSGQRQAEKKLFASLDREQERASSFPPLAALSARLGEFSALSQHQNVFGDVDAVASVSASADNYAKNLSIPNDAQQLAWFEAKFRELSEHHARRRTDDREIIQINARLAEIIGRVDRLADALPSEKTVAAIEKKLSRLVDNLDAATKQSTAQTDTMSLASKHVLDSARQVYLAKQSLETATQKTLSELNNTVSAAATITAQQIAEALQQLGPIHNQTRVEDELRALREVSRANGEKTTAALDRVHLTLSEYLERGPKSSRRGGPQEEPSDPRKRLGVHMPIGAGAPSFTRGTKEFGASGAEVMTLDSLTGRENAAEKPLESYIDRTKLTSPTARPAQSGDGLALRPNKPAQATPRTGLASQNAFGKSNPFAAAERVFPIFGVAAVAVLLLLASFALYYLQIKSPRNSGNGAQLSTAAVKRSAVSANEGSNESRPKTLEQAKTKREPVELPSIFNATGNKVFSASTAVQTTANDVQALVDAASRGDSEAQYRMGIYFLNNESLQSTDGSALRWLSRAAKQGHGEAQFLLASLFERGAGVAKDDAQAIDWYRRAASAGHERAMHNLGVLLIASDAPELYGEAAQWIERAAMGGLTHSQYNFAILYERGVGVPKNLQKAYFWYLAAAKGGDQSAKVEAERLRGTFAAEASRWRASVNVDEGPNFSRTRG